MKLMKIESTKQMKCCFFIRELFHNNIAQLQPNAFEGLTALQYLRIDRNAINCDCTIVELINEFDHNQTRVHIICETPQNLHGQSLNQFNSKDLHCGKHFHNDNYCLFDQSILHPENDQVPTVVP